MQSPSELRTRLLKIKERQEQKSTKAPSMEESRYIEQTSIEPEREDFVQVKLLEYLEQSQNDDLWLLREVVSLLDPSGRYTYTDFSGLSLKLQELLPNES